MVGGVNGYMGHAVKHVGMEQEMLLESVAIPDLLVEGKSAKELISTMRCATTLTAVLVRSNNYDTVCAIVNYFIQYSASFNIYMCVCTCLTTVYIYSTSDCTYVRMYNKFTT